MSPKTQDEIVEDQLDYVDQHRTVCIEIERRSMTEWIRKVDGDWLLARIDTHGNATFRQLSEGTVKAILKANYYQLIPASQAHSSRSDGPIWTDLDDDTTN